MEIKWKLFTATCHLHLLAIPFYFVSNLRMRLLEFQRNQINDPKILDGKTREREKKKMKRNAILKRKKIQLQNELQR